MKFVKGFCSFILQVALVIFLILLGFSFALKDTLVDLIYDQVIKREITNNVNVDENKELKKIFELEESKIFIEDILNDITSNNETGYDIEKEIIIFVKENKDELSKLYDIAVTDEEINKLEKEIKENNLNDEYNKLKEDFKINLDNDEKMFFDIYNFVVSSTFKIILISISLFNLLLIALLQKSYFKWLRALGIVSIISGIFGFGIGILIDYLLMNAFKMNALEIGYLSKYSIGLFIGGIISIIIYAIISKNNKDKENLNEVSEVC